MPIPAFFFHLNFDLADPTRTGSYKNDRDWRYDKVYQRTIAMASGQGPAGSAKIDAVIYPDQSTVPSTTGTAEHDSTTQHTLHDDSLPSQADTTNTHTNDLLHTLPERFKNGTAAPSPAPPATKGTFIPLQPGNMDDDTTPTTKQTIIQDKEVSLGWGVVRLYRDSAETEGLYDEPASTSPMTGWPASTQKSKAKKGKAIRPSSSSADESVVQQPFTNDDCTTLCILAVPSYLTPSDFLGFVGERTREDVSHFRMIRTERSNRYMVLMKFRDGVKARKWRREWNGKLFDGLEPETCHVVFVKSVEFTATAETDESVSFPDMTNDPFTPVIRDGTATGTASAAPTLFNKPVAPPTPALVELPTCPVCLERMDESTGLLTILCQHVFHCTCLQKWRGSGCPVCRYTQDGQSSLPHTTDKPYTDEDYDKPVSNECRVCHSDANLWICLLCGHVGCGRYDKAHAFAHYDATAHAFAMDMATQRVWDYQRDGYVHRILQSKADGHITVDSSLPPDDEEEGDDEPVPRSKIEALTHEYTHLLTSQLDSQRTYFEESLSRAARKTADAMSSAEHATSQLSTLSSSLHTLQNTHDTLLSQTIPEIERDRDRALARSDRAAGLARTMEAEYRSEKAMADEIRKKLDSLRLRLEQAEREGKELRETNRDLMLFVEGRKTLKSMDEDLEGASASVPTGDASNKKSKGKKKT